jgi:multiple sugar transport system substrate-binding protein
VDGWKVSGPKRHAGQGRNENDKAMTRSRHVRALFVGGPMYDPLYDAIPAFERQSGYVVDVVGQLPHPALNTMVRQVFDGGMADIDLLSTHSKYAPSQAQWLMPLDGFLPDELIGDLLPRPHELSRIDGVLLQVPRNLDVRLLHYRRDLFENARMQDEFASEYRRPLEVPGSWSELADVASFLARPNGDGLHCSGFLFPGRDSGLFGTFYELLVGSGGALFDEELKPSFASPAGVWAAQFLADLYDTRRVTPRELPAWHYDEISAEFREGHAAMVCDWPGSYHLYRSPETCRVAEHIGLALLPAGTAGVRAAYSGCHSFAIPRSAQNREGGLELLTFLTSFDSQLGEARRGSIPCRASALARIREEASADPTAAHRWELLAATEETMIVPPRFAAYPQCEDVIWQAVQHAMRGKISATEAVERAAAEAQSILDAQVGAL